MAHWSLYQDVQLRAPSRLLAYPRFLTLTVPLTSQVYKWVLAKLMLGITLRWTFIPFKVRGGGGGGGGRNNLRQ